MSTASLRVAIYSGANMNSVDGSSVWTQSVSLAFAGVENVETTLLLAHPIQNDRLLGPLLTDGRVKLVEFHDLVGDGRNTADRVAATLSSNAIEWDVVVVRGTASAEILSRAPGIAGRIWAYLTDVPQHPLDVTDEVRARMAVIGNAAQAVLCQTEALRSFMEMTFPATAGKCWLLPPMIPDLIRPKFLSAPTESSLKLVYSGKFAPAWRTLEMTALPRALEERGIDTVLTMVGDKINADPNNPNFVADMQRALSESEGVDWRGGVSREESIEVISNAHVGLSWRALSMSDSLELSTKLLEYCAAGTPPILNRSPMHKELFGSRYPLYADSEAEVVEILTRLVEAPQTYEEAIEQASGLADKFTITRSSEALSRLVDRFGRKTTGRSNRTAALIVSHDLKFFKPIQDHLARIDNVDLAADHWPGLNKHSPQLTLEAMRGADVIFCEWCGPNAIFASRHKSPGQRLVVRLHRFELPAGYWKNVDIDNVDEVITVSPHWRDLTVSTTGWPTEKVRVIPNQVDVELLRRPKVTGASFHIGMIGIVPTLKRLDLAVDIIREVLTQDPRFTLFIKSKMPWEYPWIWGNTEERDFYVDVFRGLQDEGLATRVVFDGFGGDMGAWLRKIGFVLSTSDFESFHLGPMEAMASGAVPLVRPWAGAEQIYDPHWLIEPEEMADRILKIASDEESWLTESERAMDEVESKYRLERLLPMWEDALLGEETNEVS